MTMTEARRLDDDLSREPAPSAARVHRRTLARRLPWAFVLVAIALGYWIGNHTVASSPAPALEQVVTPEQIGQALSAANAAETPAATAAPVDDRGFSKLENGIQHNHGFALPVSPADQALLSHQMALAQQTALRYPTLADAQKAGMFRAGPFSPGLGTHMTMAANIAYAAGSGVMTDEQIAHPMSWIYAGTKPGSPVVGLFYMASVPDPAGFAGPNDVWHQHKNICITINPKGGIDAPLGADRDATVEQCTAVGGRLIPATGPLLHTWVVPGYEDPQGVFSHLNPAVTCDDGTYNAIDVTTAGTRTSTCVDGTE